MDLEWLALDGRGTRLLSRHVRADSTPPLQALSRLLLAHQAVLLGAQLLQRVSLLGVQFLQLPLFWLQPQPRIVELLSLRH